MPHYISAMCGRVTQRSGELPGLASVMGDGRDSRITDPKGWVRYNGGPSQDFWLIRLHPRDRRAARPAHLGADPLPGKGRNRVETAHMVMVTVTTADGRKRTGRVVAHQAGSRLTKRGTVTARYDSIELATATGLSRSLSRHRFDRPTVGPPPGKLVTGKQRQADARSSSREKSRVAWRRPKISPVLCFTSSDGTTDGNAYGPCATSSDGGSAGSVGNALALRQAREAIASGAAPCSSLAMPPPFPLRRMPGNPPRLLHQDRQTAFSRLSPCLFVVPGAGPTSGPIIARVSRAASANDWGEP
jgi:hypothetical protein